MTQALVHSLAEIADIFAEDAPAGGRAIVQTIAGELLDSKAIARAAARISSHSLGWGDRLVVLCQPTIETIATMVAAWHVGVVVCPLPPGTQLEVLQTISADCGVRFAVDPTHDCWTEIGSAPSPVSPVLFRTPPRVTGPDLALIIYSSGSTGSPKGIMLSHANVLSALRSVAGYLGLTAADTIYSVPPLHFDYGLYQVLLACFTDCRVVVASAGTAAQQALLAIAAIRPTVVPIVPALGSGLALLGKLRAEKLESVRLITNTGGHLPEGVIQSLRVAFPRAAVMPMYGLTESKRALFIQPELVEVRPGSVGRPMPGLEAKVIVAQPATHGRSLREAEPHEVGELWVRGASVMQGYTAAASGAGAEIVPGQWRDDNWLATGDLFSTDEHGFFYFRGRSKELIKQGGYCLYPRDIEAVVEQNPLVGESVVIGVTDRFGDEIACLFVRMRDEGNLEDVAAWLKEKFDNHYMPRRWHAVDTWPINSNGKIDRKALKAWAERPGATGRFQYEQAMPT